MGNKNIEITRSKVIHEVYGKITRIVFLNRSKVYITNKGLNFVLPKTKKHLDLIEKKNNIEINCNPDELRLIFKELKLAGYNYV